jgi:4-aminobutyrate aminotransferase-like enzyme
VDGVGSRPSPDRFVLHSLRRDPCVTFVRGENARLWDASGRLYLDTMSGSAGPAMVGHANRRVAAAVARQMATPLTTPEEDFERMLDLVEEVARFIEERVKGRVAAHT